VKKVADYPNRYDYLAADEKELKLLKTLDIKAEEVYKNIAEENNLISI